MAFRESVGFTENHNVIFRIGAVIIDIEKHSIPYIFILEYKANEQAYLLRVSDYVHAYAKLHVILFYFTYT